MNFRKMMLIVLSSAICSVIVQSCSQSANAETSLPIVKANTVETITWNTLEGVTQKVKTSPKKVIVDVYTDWCKWCKVMDDQTFSDSRVVSYVNQNFHMVKLNAEQKSNIQFRGDEYTYVQSGRRGYNQVAVELLKGKLSFPSLVILDTELNTVSVVPGFQTPEKLLEILKQV